VPILDRVATNPATGGAAILLFRDRKPVYIAGGSVVQNGLPSTGWDRPGQVHTLRGTPGLLRPSALPGREAFAMHIRDGKRLTPGVRVERDIAHATDLSRLNQLEPVGHRRPELPILPGKRRSVEPHWTRADGAGDALPLPKARTKRPNSWTRCKVWRHELDSDTFLGYPDAGHRSDEKSGWKPGEPKPFLKALQRADAAFLARCRLARYAPTSPELQV